MKTYFIDRNGSQPIYEQLYDQIKTEIQNGIWKEHDKLPSKRMLADHLKLSIQTIETTYEQLLAEGYIYSKPKSGFFVESGIHHSTVKHIQDYEALIQPKQKELKYLYDCRTNRIDASMFPSVLWSRLIRDELSKASVELWNQSDYQGLPLLREAIANLLLEFRGISIHPNQIIVGPGMEYLIPMLFSVIGRNQRVGLEVVGYRKTVLIYQTNGISIESIPLDESGVISQELSLKNLSLLHITPSHQFPTGIVMPIKRRLELLKWMAEADHRYIIEDDYDSEFRFIGQPIPALKSLDTWDRVIYFNSFTKSIAPGIRIAYMVLPIALIAKARQTFQSFHCPLPNLEQITLAHFIHEGHFERHLSRLKVAYRNRRDELINALECSLLNPYLSIHGEDAGLHFVLELKTNRLGRELVDAAKQHNVLLSALKEYEVDYDLPDFPYLILGYSELKSEQLPGFIAALEAAWMPLLENEENVF